MCSLRSPMFLPVIFDHNSCLACLGVSMPPAGVNVYASPKYSKLHLRYLLSSAFYIWFYFKYLWTENMEFNNTVWISVSVEDMLEFAGKYKRKYEEGKTKMSRQPARPTASRTEGGWAKQISWEQKSEGIIKRRNSGEWGGWGWWQIS